MRKVRINGTPPADWIAEAEALSEQLRNANNATERKQIIDDNEGFWRDKRIHQWLLDQFHNKCWYSEAADCVSPDHVDHFRPKGRIRDEETKVTEEGYWWLAFDWKNYRICGHLLNSKKNDLFPLAEGARSLLDGNLRLEAPFLIDPTKDEARLISFRIDEDACVADTSIGANATQSKRVEKTIDILGLNRLDKLNQKRFKTWNRAMDRVLDYRSAQETQGAQCLALVQETAALHALREMTQYDVEFSSVAQACVRRHAPEALAASVSDL